MFVANRVNQLLSAFQLRPEQQTLNSLASRAFKADLKQKPGRPVTGAGLSLGSSQYTRISQSNVSRNGACGVGWAAACQARGPRLRSRSSEGGSAGVGAARGTDDAPWSEMHDQLLMAEYARQSRGKARKSGSATSLVHGLLAADHRSVNLASICVYASTTMLITFTCGSSVRLQLSTPNCGHLRSPGCRHARQLSCQADLSGLSYRLLPLALQSVEGHTSTSNSLEGLQLAWHLLDM